MASILNSFPTKLLGILEHDIADGRKLFESAV